MSSKVELQTNTTGTSTPTLSPPSSTNSNPPQPTTITTTTTGTTTTTATTTSNKLSTDDPISLKRKNSSNSSSNSSGNSPPKRHRPLSLNLGIPDNADVALRIVSPGLPPNINEAMKSTIQLSKQIQQQQKNLIAARHSNKDQEQDEDQPQPQSQAPIIETVTSTQQPTESTTLPHASPKSPVYAADDSDLNRLSNVKKLKRHNVPPPLSINENPTVNTLRPSIHSAPIRTRPRPRMVPTTRIVPQPQYYYVNTPYQQYYQPLPQPLPHQPQVQPHQILPRSQLRQINPRYRMIPLTSTATHFGRRATLHGTSIHQQHQHQQQQQQQHHQLHPSLQHPPQQPPVTQLVPATSHQAPKSKPNAVTDVFHGDFKKAAPLSSQPLSAQREYFGSSVHDELPTSQVITINEAQDVSGSITINGSNVFNFKIFNKSNNHEEEPSEDNAEDEEEYNKKKFLKICETCWNQVFNKKDD